MNQLPPNIIVELTDGHVISAELVKVVGDSIVSVALYKEIDVSNARPPNRILVAMEQNTQNALAMVEKAMLQGQAVAGIKQPSAPKTGKMASDA